MMFLALMDGIVDFSRENSSALTIGLTVTGIGMAFGGAHGYAMNPAADSDRGCSRRRPPSGITA